MPVSTRSQSSSSPTAIRARFTVTNEPNNKEQANTVQSINGLPPPSSLAGTAHFANLRSLSNRRANIFRAGHEKGGEAEAIGGGVLKKHTETKHVVKLSHDSVSLLTSRVVRSEPGDKRRALSVHSRRNSTVGVEAKTETQSVVKIKDTFSTDDRMQENLETPLPSHCQNIGHQALGNYNWAREADGELQLNGESTTRCSSRPFMATKAPFSCPKPMLSTDNAEMGSAGFLSGYRGQTDLKPVCRVRKRPFNEELETVREEEAQGQASRIMVYVRLRPMAKKEKEAGARSCVRVVNKRDVYLTEFALETDYLRLKRLKGRHFAFDAAFPDTTGQQEVYNTSTAELVEGVLQGRNGSVFCYGATGAGKTYTMLGTVQNPGVMVLALKDLFLKLRQRSREGGYLVRLSYLEVYNESVRDLLSPGRPLVLREDSKQGIVAAGLTQYEAYSADEVMALLQQGNQNRTTEPTRVNETSSRSHAILQVVVEYKVQQDCLSISRVGKLSLIDLAGSERALATDQRTLRSLEGANINRSLLALSSCINALVEGKKHIPFRNSKLTQLLKDSLGGACQTSMIANISPSNLSFGETQNTLHWADRAKEIRTKACIANEELQVPESESEQAKVLLEVQKENQQLRMQLARLQQKLLTVQSNAIAQSPSVIGPPNPCPSSPFTPLRPERAACSPICRTPEPNIYREEDKNAESRTIQELQNTVQVLEKEKEQMRRDSALREEQLAASIAALNREHSVQLRHKELFIRTLCQKTITESSLDTLPEKPSISKSPSQQEQGRTRVSDTVATTRVSRRMSGTLMQGTGTPISTAPRVPSDRQRRFVTPKVSTKPCPLPRPGRTSLIPESEQQRTRAGRLSRTPQVIPKTTPLPRFCSPSKDLVSSSRKRTFWDITNANSPSSAPSSGRCTRSNIATSTPSMLLQPGFLRGRPSLN